MESIKVSLRIRPLNQKETKENQKPILIVDQNTVHINKTHIKELNKKNMYHLHITIRQAFNYEFN